MKKAAAGESTTGGGSTWMNPNMIQKRTTPLRKPSIVILHETTPPPPPSCVRHAPFGIPLSTTMTRRPRLHSRLEFVQHPKRSSENDSHIDFVEPWTTSQRFTSLERFARALDSKGLLFLANGESIYMWLWILLHTGMPSCHLSHIHHLTLSGTSNGASHGPCSKEKTPAKHSTQRPLFGTIQSTFTLPPLVFASGLESLFKYGHLTPTVIPCSRDTASHICPPTLDNIN